MFNEYYPKQQIFEHYEKWEDYINGMYRNEQENADYFIGKAKIVLSDPYLFKDVALNVISNWIIATSVNFTNNGINKRAWLGQASCCYKYNVPEFFTRIAWKELTEYQRISANLVAKEIIHNWIEQKTKSEQTTIKF